MELDITSCEDFINSRVISKFEKCKGQFEYNLKLVLTSIQSHEKKTKLIQLFNSKLKTIIFDELDRLLSNKSKESKDGDKILFAFQDIFDSIFISIDLNIESSAKNEDSVKKFIKVLLHAVNISNGIAGGTEDGSEHEPKLSAIKEVIGTYTESKGEEKIKEGEEEIKAIFPESKEGEKRTSIIKGLETFKKIKDILLPPPPPTTPPSVPSVPPTTLPPTTPQPTTIELSKLLNKLFDIMLLLFKNLEQDISFTNGEINKLLRASTGDSGITNKDFMLNMLYPDGFINTHLSNIKVYLPRLPYFSVLNQIKKPPKTKPQEPSQEPPKTPDSENIVFILFLVYIMFFYPNNFVKKGLINGIIKGSILVLNNVKDKSILERVFTILSELNIVVDGKQFPPNIPSTTTPHTSTTTKQPKESELSFDFIQNIADTIYKELMKTSKLKEILKQKIKQFDTSEKIKSGIGGIDIFKELFVSPIQPIALPQEPILLPEEPILLPEEAKIKAILTILLPSPVVKKGGARHTKKKNVTYLNKTKRKKHSSKKYSLEYINNKNLAKLTKKKKRTYKKHKLKDIDNRNLKRQSKRK